MLWTVDSQRIFCSFWGKFFWDESNLSQNKNIFPSPPRSNVNLLLCYSSPRQKCVILLANQKQKMCTQWHPENRSKPLKSAQKKSKNSTNKLKDTHTHRIFGTPYTVFACKCTRWSRPPCRYQGPLAGCYSPAGWTWFRCRRVALPHGWCGVSSASCSGWPPWRCIPGRSSLVCSSHPSHWSPPTEDEKEELQRKQRNCIIKTASSVILIRLNLGLSLFIRFLSTKKWRNEEKNGNRGE